ncbi:multidrug effflux MFS transporter [Ponticoccus sp. SC2-23]|uniref:multidrug effflux MFS transporter n=1 Tax=Alexandriicola marinus TaxID=2081710 RepID=UPI000FDBF282|nr:multidrug effflux MFS transporter [Alexandriicola marinus]MBM1222391.1 multidrug effflux MFS transporter [Ponticoccus sp. SC6-9]MBM1224504.1 multidrug effflux MFS transporter [Ponticoccus sp. SC6-15]MBM1229716.1 multidrug effflux MFS transporter [Ponticoccus sp. SC6-38]MBM1233470.1 multidrug effflux MFS transporter [Ponticoccus sp. SC6-45]MBM1236580.1 multidrug effflux MFS transporter [Ponticoccus sp. SC6-49]MBM1244624.1 multidrug effflux MFS transporter [Ponticoccus sp. SC2-64]MBM1246994
MPFFRLALTLGLLSTVGPFAIDMYLPALPRIEAALDASVAEVQMTLTVYFAVFGISQLFWGPLSDRYGRKGPIFVGLGIFALASVACAMAPTIGWLLVFRGLQGIGAAVVMVTPRAIIRDLYTGPQATRLMALVMLVISVSPMLAPLAGSGLMVLGDWRLMFWALAVATVLSILLTGFALPETLPPERRVPIRIRTLISGARILMTDSTFMGLTMVGAFGFSSFFVFLASASFVYTGQFGLSPTQFSLAFAINAIGFFGMSQIAGPVTERFGLLPVIRVAVLGFAAFNLTLLAIVVSGGGTLPVIVGMLFLGNACLGLVIPTTMVAALDPHGQMAGLASSLGGTLQMVTGGLIVTLAGPFFDGTALPMVAAIAVCSVLALTLVVTILPRIARAAV